MPSRNNNRNAGSAANTGTEANNNNNNNNNNRSSKPSTTKPSTAASNLVFHGRCADLPNTAIYDFGVYNQADMFVKTTKEIAIYAGSKLSYGTDAKLSIEAMSKVTIVK